MKCPICGCKMKNEIMCPYCKITGEQVKNASNKEAKKRIAKRDSSEVYDSTYVPMDINNTRLMLITLFGGIFGVHRMYLGKFKSGIIFPISIVLTVLFYVLTEVYGLSSTFMTYASQFFYLVEGLLLMLWISDFLRVIFKSFPIPVVLAEKETGYKERKK